MRPLDCLNLKFARLDLSLSEKELSDAWLSGFFAAHAYNMREICCNVPMPETKQEELNLRHSWEAVARLIKYSKQHTENKT